MLQLSTFRRTVSLSFSLLLAVFVGGVHPTIADTTTIHCLTEADGEIASRDHFVWDAEIFTDFTATGSFTHVTPWQSSTVGTCPAILLERDGVCREMQRLGMSSPDCQGVRTALENNPYCTPENVLEGTITAGICIRNGRTNLVFEGSGNWNGISGYTFLVSAWDGATDSYSITIKRPDLTIAYSASGDLTAGDISATVP